VINLDTDRPGQHNAGHRNLALHMRSATNPGSLWRQIDSPQGELSLGAALLIGLAVAELAAATLL
jgi:hypothetical protein